MSNNRTAPQDATEILDPDDNRWHFVRGPLDPRAAKRLVRTAHTVLEGYLATPEPWGVTSVPADRRDAYWQQIRRGLEDRQAEVSYTAYEYGSSDGLRLVFLQRHC